MFKIGLLAAAISVPQAAEVVVGGNIPLISNITVFPELSLDFGSAGTLVPIAKMVVNNNSASFDVKVTFSSAGAEFLTAAGYGSATTEGIALTDLTIVQEALGPFGQNAAGDGPGDLIIDVTAAATPGVGAAATGDLSDVTWIDPADNAAAANNTWIWNPNNQENATVGGVLVMKGSWVRQDKLAGLYTQNLIVTIEATL